MDLSWLWGGNGETYQLGQFGKSRPFPSKEDLEFARKYGEFQHSGEYTPNTFQVEEATSPVKTQDIRDLSFRGELPPPTDQELIDTLARNKLASHRSAIASLATNDPNDQVVGAKDFTYSGFAGKTYVDPTREDPMWTFFGREREENPSTPIHEATHRGLYKVIDEIVNTNGDPELREFINDPDNNELMVRKLMHDLFDDVERPRMPGKYQVFLDDPNGVYKRNDVDDALAKAEAIAQKMVQRRKPGGPW